MNIIDSNTNNTGLPIWSGYVSQTEVPIFSDPTTTTGQKIVFESSILE